MNYLETNRKKRVRYNPIDWDSELFRVNYQKLPKDRNFIKNLDEYSRNQLLELAYERRDYIEIFGEISAELVYKWTNIQ